MCSCAVNFAHCAASSPCDEANCASSSGHGLGTHGCARLILCLRPPECATGTTWSLAVGRNHAPPHKPELLHPLGGEASQQRGRWSRGYRGDQGQGRPRDPSDDRQAYLASEQPRILCGLHCRVAGRVARAEAVVACAHRQQRKAARRSAQGAGGRSQAAAVLSRSWTRRFRCRLHCLANDRSALVYDESRSQGDVRATP
mmetsp:Transcript_16339/g.49759  ORF Transcript_16339/g.49759 Transcript_16339/m.49759 type:complete len:200 (+) Transcript_16339:1371-1970(+)